MKGHLIDRLRYLFIPEESCCADRPGMRTPIFGGKRQAAVSFKAIFWAGMAITAALMLGKLS